MSRWSDHQVSANAGHGPPVAGPVGTPDLTRGEATVPVDAEELRREIRDKYREVAENPAREYHFHTGKAHAVRLGYPASLLDSLPNEACDSFAGVGNPFHWGMPQAGERVVDLGSGGGLDSFLAALSVGPSGNVIGVDMTAEMIARSRRGAERLGLDNLDFRHGLVENLPVDDGWADVVISNGVINLCPDKRRVYGEIARVLRAGGRMTIADICVERPVPESALRDIELWTG